MEQHYIYLAGIIDGEGTITIHRHPQYNRKTFALRPRIIVTNTHKGLIENLQDLHGGTIAKQEARTVNYKPVYLWRISKTLDILSILLRCEPYMIIKKPHAELMIEYCRSRLLNQLAPYSGRQKNIYSSIAGMNKK